MLLVHAVNPWGMAWWRRQNESNVDLNRNWRRDDGEPFVNEAYDELHPLACPDTPELPPISEVLDAASALVAERGLTWVRDGITVGQYRHPDGLHCGGARTEESNRILEPIVQEALTGAERVLTVDLHTGHGPYGALVALSDQPPGSPQDEFLRRWSDRVEATTGNPEATTGLKAGQIANGFRALVPDAECFSTSLEVGTADDLTQLGATYQEHWVHRHGDRGNPVSAPKATPLAQQLLDPSAADPAVSPLHPGRRLVQRRPRGCAVHRSDLAGAAGLHMASSARWVHQRGGG